MANTKISALNAITGANAASGDLIPIVDVSASETKSITRAELFASPPAIGGTTPAAGAFTTLTSTDVSSVTANSASAALTVTQTGAGNAFVVEDSASTDSTPFVINAAGIAVAGHTASIPGAFSDESPLQCVVAGGAAQFSGYRFSANTGGTNFYLYKSRAATAGTNTIVQSGDVLGAINFAGADGTTYHRAALILSEVDGTPGLNDMPGRLVFSTTADGASSPTEAMRIDSTQSVFNNAAGSGTNAYGFNTSSAKIGATNNYGFYSNIASAANRYNFYAAGSAPNYFAGDVECASYIRAFQATATPAGGAANTGILMGSAVIGVYFGSGAPTVSATKGSLYLRSDGSTTNDRMYTNTDGGTTWTAVTTAA